MEVKIYADRETMSRAAAEQASLLIRQALESRGRARIVAATGASQFAFLDALVAEPGIDWASVELFHLDEYVGLPLDHPASFRKYLLDRLISRTGIVDAHLLDAEHDPAAAATEVGALLAAAQVDVAFAGIGENGHLAFNDPPADFETEEPYLVVELDEACRRQQVGEGWFPSLDDVPRRAVSMSIRQILKSTAIICLAPESRKARAVQMALEGEISPAVPASILRTHPNATLYLDHQSASALRNPPPTAA